jgi:AraC family transcriptional regulator of adaptative response / DNA-3-methyladenine glycosylase II
VDCLFPDAARVAALAPERIARLGVIALRARAIVALAQSVASGAVRLDPSAEVGATLGALRKIAGIGPWTAQYITMRALSWPDAFPHPDVAVAKALGGDTPRRALARAEDWRPWRSYAVLHLWRSLVPASRKETT